MLCITGAFGAGMCAFVSVGGAIVGAADGGTVGTAVVYPGTVDIAAVGEAVGDADSIVVGAAYGDIGGVANGDTIGESAG